MKLAAIAAIIGMAVSQYTIPMDEDSAIHIAVGYPLNEGKSQVSSLIDEDIIPAKAL